MAGERILVVEDELIVAQDLQDILKRLGYQIAGRAASGEEAIEKSAETQPDLVLMDIRLKGSVDGIEAAETIWSRQGIPVTYLTAYADENTLERAKATMPFGYILKPFEERDLRTSIEIALYKHSMESVAEKMEGWYASTLDSVGDAIIATNAQGCLTFMNQAAESLTGWSLREIYGKKFNDVFQIATDKTQAPALNPIEEVLAKTSPSPLRHQAGLLLVKNGGRIHVECVMTPIKEKEGGVAGRVVIVRHPIPQTESQGATG